MVRKTSLFYSKINYKQFGSLHVTVRNVEM